MSYELSNGTVDIRSYLAIAAADSILCISRVLILHKAVSLRPLCFAIDDHLHVMRSCSVD